jgi:hypothetical protein
MTGSVIVGSALVVVMVRTPEPGMLKAMVSKPELALASRIACRSDPAPASLVLVTVRIVCPTILALSKLPELAFDGPARELEGNSVKARSMRPRSTQATDLAC